MDLNKLNKDARIVFLLLLTQLVQDKLVESEGYEHALEALQHCWDWVLYKNIKAFDFYYYLGNDDGNDVTTFSLLLGQQEEVRFYKEDEKGVAEMCKVMEDMRNETAKKTKEQTTTSHIIDIMEKLKYTAEQAMDLLNIPQAERATYVGLVEKR